MKIDTSSINGFDEMSADDKVKALLGFEIEVPDDKSEEVKKYKDLTDKYSSQIASMKQELKKNLDDDERAKQETRELIDTLRSENETLKKSQQIATLKASYIGMGYEDKLAEKKAKAVTENDTEKMLACEAEYRDFIEKAIRADVVKGTPKPDSLGKGTETMTKEKLQKMSPAERFNYAKEHADDYKRIYTGE